MQGEFVDALPGSILFAPDEDATVVGGRGENGAIFGVRPGDTPDCSLMPFECFQWAVLVAVDFEELDRLVGGAGRQSLAVVVEDRVVLDILLERCWLMSCRTVHTIISSWPELEMTCAWRLLARRQRWM